MNRPGTLPLAVTAHMNHGGGWSEAVAGGSRTELQAKDAKRRECSECS